MLVSPVMTQFLNFGLRQYQNAIFLEIFKKNDKIYVSGQINIDFLYLIVCYHWAHVQVHFNLRVTMGYSHCTGDFQTTQSMSETPRASLGIDECYIDD